MDTVTKLLLLLLLVLVLTFTRLQTQVTRVLLYLVIVAASDTSVRLLQILNGMMSQWRPYLSARHPKMPHCLLIYIYPLHISTYPSPDRRVPSTSTTLSTHLTPAVSMSSGSQSRIFEWLAMIEDEPVPSDTPRWSYPCRNFPKVQDFYGKLPGIENQPRRSTSVICVESIVRESDASLQHLGPSCQQVAHVPRVQEQALETYRKQHCPWSVGSVSCLMSSQKVASKRKEERFRYERQPRHKTKDDHYEYKGKMSHKKGGRVTKTKRRRSTKRNRKHTVNDNFHASNVARDRLTVS